MKERIDEWMKRKVQTNISFSFVDGWFMPSLSRGGKIYVYLFFIFLFFLSPLLVGAFFPPDIINVIRLMRGDINFMRHFQMNKKYRLTKYKGLNLRRYLYCFFLSVTEYFPSRKVKEPKWVSSILLSLLLSSN